MNKYFNYILLIAAATALFSCRDLTEYRVGSDFQQYVDGFEQEAALRNRNFNFESSGLIIEFGDLEEGVAGLCHYQKPIRIEVDRDYWNSLSDQEGTELMREELLFHELGHGILNRTHTNSVLINDEWKSIMCGGDEIAGRTWNINYRGERRKYYLDELFNESTPEPAFATEGLTVDTTGFATTYTDEFSNTASTKWKLGATSNGTASIENGMLKYVSNSSVNLIILIAAGIDVQSDFIYECTLQYTGFDNTAKYGLVFGTYTNESATVTSDGASLEYILINNDRKMTIGNRAWFSYFTQITRTQIVPQSRNKIKVVKKGDRMYFFINGEYAYRSEMVNRKTGYNYGFSVPPKSTLLIDDFRLAASETNASAAKIKSAEIENMEMKVVEAEFPAGEINNR